MAKNIVKATPGQLAALESPEGQEVFKWMAANGWLDVNLLELKKAIPDSEAPGYELLRPYAATGGKSAAIIKWLLIIAIIIGIWQTMTWNTGQNITAMSLSTFVLWGALGVAVGTFLKRNPARIFSKKA